MKKTRVTHRHLFFLFFLPVPSLFFLLSNTSSQPIPTHFHPSSFTFPSLNTWKRNHHAEQDYFNRNVSFSFSTRNFRPRDVMPLLLINHVPSLFRQLRLHANVAFAMSSRGCQRISILITNPRVVHTTLRPGSACHQTIFRPHRDATTAPMDQQHL